MTREFRREMHFSAFCKLAEKYFLVGMNSLGTLREYIGNGCMQIHPLGVLWRRLTFILFIYFFTYSFIYLLLLLLLIFFFQIQLLFLLLLKYFF